MRQIRPELGVYVLGAIVPADRAMVDRHLASCPRCREEVAGLTGLPALLRKVPIDAVMQLPGEPPHDPPGPPQALVGGLIGQVAAVRRRRRRSLAAAAAVLAAAAAGWALHLLQPAAHPQRAAASWWAAATGARAAVRYTAQPWGNRGGGQRQRQPARDRLPDLGYHRHLAARGRRGWTVTRGDPHAWYPASVPIPAGSLASFGITAHGKVLVTIPLRPGTRTAPANAATVPASIPVTR